VGNRLFQVVAYGPQDFVNSKNADDYFASFKIDD
jgi:hypothetical protein